MFTLTPWLGGERVGQGVNVCAEFVGCLPSPWLGGERVGQGVNVRV